MNFLAMLLEVIQVTVPIFVIIAIGYFLRHKKIIKEETITLIVQINGKVRDKIEVQANISEKEAQELTFKREKVKKWILDKKVKKVIFVKNKLINIVI